MAKATRQGGTISKRAVDYGREAIGNWGESLGEIAGGLAGSRVGAVGGIEAAAPYGIPSAGMAPIIGAGLGSVVGLVGGATEGGKYGKVLAEKLYDLVSGKPNATQSDVVNAVLSAHPGLSSAEKVKTANCLLSKSIAANGTKLTPDQINQCLPTKPGTPQPQASRASCLEAAASKLKGAGYLAKTFQYNPAKPWSDEFDKGFRDYIEAASGGKALLATNPKLGWADVAASFNLPADLSGACSAITSDTLTAPIKTAPETSAGTTNPASGETATPVAATKEDILPKILSYMQNTKIAETVGLNLIAEPRRASILIEAAGGVDNAANVLHNKTEGLSAALQPIELTGPITPEWVRRNKPVLQQIVGAINALVSSAVRSVGKLSLLPADRAKAVAKMKSFINQAHQNIQWTKIASKRKDRIRSEVATEMTVEDRVIARRIKARESV